MKATWENKHIVFDLNDGPKTMTDALNLEGNDGWEVASIVNIQNNRKEVTKLCVFLKRATYIETPTHDDEVNEEISKLWGGK